MSDDLAGLVPVYSWLEENLPKSDGSRRKRRSSQLIIKQFNIPVMNVGHLKLTDPVLAAQRLREHLVLVDRAPRKPGRPPRAA
jgi:hypothetical protein